METRTFWVSPCTDKQGRNAEEQITLRMLLSYTAGLPAASRGGESDADGLENYVREQIPRYSFSAPPGQFYSYANAGFSLADYIVHCELVQRE